jgi:hypothetical protein
MGEGRGEGWAFMDRSCAIFVGFAKAEGAIHKFS